MSLQLHTALQSILAMPYYKNEHARSGDANYGHEAAVAKRIMDAGFIEKHKSEYPGITKALLKRWAETEDDSELRNVAADLPDGSYILQPSGSQGFPDVLVKDHGGRFVAIECKSTSTDVCPMWNDNLPKPTAIYVLSSGGVNETTVFLGRDVMSSDILDNQKRMLEEMKMVVEKYREINAKHDVYQRGWDTKFRPQNFQYGGKHKTDYFSHPDRKRCELNVIEYAKL